MANVFLSTPPVDVETAIIYEKATIHDIKKSVAYVNGEGQMYVNTEDNLRKILPCYNHDMLKWILWHEKFHTLLNHPKRYLKYAKNSGKFTLTHQEVNIIMDILVHDQLEKRFPELIPLAMLNLAQFRHNNSLKYTFKTYTLEKMLEEYQEYKDSQEQNGGGPGTPVENPPQDGPQNPPIEDPQDGPTQKSPKKSPTEDEPPAEDKKNKSGNGRGTEDDEDDEDNGSGVDETEDDTEDEQPEDTHDNDWDKLKDREDKEFLTEMESDEIDREVERLNIRKIRLAQLTETLSGLATTTRKRSYAMPSSIKVSDSILLKGRTPGKAALHLCFDASGSMSSQLKLFRDIITNSIPHALETPTTWFSGYISGGYDASLEDTADNKRLYGDYYKGQFKDIMRVWASDGYSDDGDRTIELCWLAEQEGYTPIGITDGGSRLSWSKKQLAELKRTILVVPEYESWWADRVKEVNSNIQIIIV